MTYDIDIFKPSTTTEKKQVFLFHRLVGSNWAGPYHHRRDHQGHVFPFVKQNVGFFHWWSLQTQKKVIIGH